MVDAGQGFGLLREFPDQPPVPPGVFEQEFDHHRHSVQSFVARQKDHADPAAPELALDKVSPFKSAARPRPWRLRRCLVGSSDMSPAESRPCRAKGGFGPHLRLKTAGARKVSKKN